MRARVQLATVLATVLAATALLGGCGFPAEDTPRMLSADEVGFDLLSPTTAPPTTIGPNVETEKATLYLADPEDGVVRPVIRPIPKPKNVDTVLRALFQLRPSKEDEDDGLTNVITPQTQLLEVTETTDEAGMRIKLNLASYFPGLSSEEVSLAIAQIVFTLDNLDNKQGVGVSILIESQLEDVRTDDGKSVQQVTKADLMDFDVATVAASSSTVLTVTTTPAG